MGIRGNGANKVDLAPHDHAQLRSIFSIDATSLSSTASTPAPFLATMHRPEGDGQLSGCSNPNSSLPTTTVAIVATIEAFDTSRFSIVGSIAGSTDAYLVTPKHWGLAMKSPFKREWLDGLFKHLDGCLQYGTYGLPQIPPTNVMVVLVDVHFRVTPYTSHPRTRNIQISHSQRLSSNKDEQPIDSSS
jgi:hypothetical protein